MSELTGRYSALCTPADVDLWAAESSYTQAGPRPGIPVPSQDSQMALTSSGTQAAGSSILVQSVRGGFPGTAAAQSIWRNSTDSNTTDWRGWNTPQVLEGWEVPLWSSASTLTTQDPHALTLADGTVLAVCQVRDTTYTGTTGEYRVEVFSRATSTGVWSRILVYGQDTSPSVDYLPCLVLLPSGRILCYHLMIDVGATRAGIRMWHSDDSGATWSYGGDTLTPAAAIATATVTPTRLRAAYRDGQVLALLSWVYASGAVSIRNRVAQYASCDDGNTFTPIGSVTGEWSPTDESGTPTSGGYFEVVSTDLGFCVSYLTAAKVQCRTVADAFTPMSLGAAITVGVPASVCSDGGTGATAISDGDLALAADDAGVLYLYLRVIATGEGIVLTSTDQGGSWGGMGRSAAYTAHGYWHYQGASTDVPVDICAAWHRGRMLVLGNWRAGTGDEDVSLGVWIQGGYTSIPMRILTMYNNPSDRAGWERTWLPFEEPQDSGWTGTGAATTEDLVTPGRLQLTVAAANTRYYELVPAMSPATGMVVACEVLTTAGSLSTNRVALAVRYSDGAVGYGVDIRFASTGYAVYDSTSAAQIGSNQTIDVTAGVEVLVAMYGDEVVVYHRARGSVASKLWIAGPTSTALSDAGAVTDYVRFGVQATAATDDTTYWYRTCITYGGYAGQPITRASWPTDLIGRAYSSRPIYVDGGVSVRAEDGPTWIGDRWTISTRYDHEIRRCYEDTSPRRTWRSTSTAAQVIAFSWRDGSGEDGYGEGGLLAIPILGSNVSQVTVALYDADTSTWTTVGTAELGSGMVGMRASTAGPSSRPESTTDAANVPRLRSNEFAGATFRINATYSRRIRCHTEGVWGKSATSRIRPTITLVDTTGAETAASTAAGIIPSQSVILVDLAGTAYSGVRLTIPQATGSVPQPAESYYEIGYCRPMWVHLLARDPDWGQARSLSAGVEVVEARDRTRAARVVAPPRRALEVSWMDGIDQSEIEQLDGSIPARHVGVSESQATLAGVGYQLSGVLRRVDGPADVLLYLERIPAVLTSAYSVINRRDRLMLCRMESPIQVESAQGEPGIDEVIRIASVALVEEV